MSDKNNLPAKLTDRGGRAARKALGKAGKGSKKSIPGPSTNPATNLLAADIAMRSAMRLFRRTVEKGLLRARFDPGTASDIVEGRSLGQTLVSAAAARMATRSVPGALLIGGGILAKTLVDRSLSRRKSVRKGDRELEEQAKDA